MLEMIVPKPHSGVTLLKSKEAEWLVVNGSVEENLARSSEQAKGRIIGAVMRRNGLPSTELKVVAMQDKVVQRNSVLPTLIECLQGSLG